jgi:rhamnosyltransferase
MNSFTKKNKSQASDISGNPTVAVLMAAYNGIPWIEEQINSILTQKNISLDLFISVDLSTDATYELCKNLSSKHRNIHILDYGKKYGSAASNFYRLIRDVDFSAYDYISLADQDDTWTIHKLASGIKALAQTRAAAYSSDITAVWANKKEVRLKKSYPLKRYDYYFEGAGPGCVYILSVPKFLGFKDFLKEHYEKINTISGHDWLIYAYYRANKFEWFIDSNSYIKYRQHDKNSVGARVGLTAYFSRIKAIRKGWYFQDQYKITELINKILLDRPLERNLIWYTKNIFSLRRKKSDALILFIFILFGYFR